MLSRTRRAGGVLGCKRSIASMEFALVAPLMLVLLGGVYDTSEALILYTEVYNCAHTIPDSASSYAVQGDGATILTYDEIQLMESEIWADIPELRSGGKVSSSTSVTLTSVTFSVGSGAACQSKAVANSAFQIGSGCTYDADQLWSVAYNPATTGAAYTGPSTFVKELRECYLAAQINPSAANPASPITTYLDTLPVANLGTTGVAIPSSFYSSFYQLEAGPAPILVTDVQFTYKPGFSFIFHGNVSFWVIGLWPVRNVYNYSPLIYDSANATWYTQANYPGGIVNGNFYTVEEPLQQQFTEIAGTETNSGQSYASTSLYDPDSEVVGGNNDSNVSTADGPATTSWCIFNYANNPPPVTTSYTSGMF